VLALVSAGVLTVLELVEAALVFPAADEYRQAAVLGTDSADIFTPYEAVSAFAFLVFAFGYVATCLWLQRARVNADALRPWHHHARSRGWVWGGWVCPVVSLWFPYQVVRDVRGATAPRSAKALLGVWWGAWLAYLISLQVAGRLIPWSGPPDETAIGWLVPMEVVNALLCAVAFGCWISIVRGVQTDQRQAASLPQPPAPPPAPPVAQPHTW